MHVYGPRLPSTAWLLATLLALVVSACAQLPTRPSSGPITDVPADVPHASSQRLSSV
jgi:hypothetical protein